MYLLTGAIELFPDVFTKSKPFEYEFSALEIKYDGFAVIDGVPCHIIHFIYPDNINLSESWWFFGSDDFLPREVRRLYNLIPNRRIEEILRITNLEPNISISDSEFNLKAPEDFEVKEYQGFASPKPSLLIGDVAPDWTLFDSQGKQFSLKDFQGKIVIMDFWATWCGPCLKLMPEIQKIHETFQNEDVVVLSINIWESGDPDKYMRENGYTYKVLIKGEDIAKKYSVNGIPTLYIIGKDGKIIFGDVGFKSDIYQKIVESINKSIKNK